MGLLDHAMVDEVWRISALLGDVLMTDLGDNKDIVKKFTAVTVADCTADEERLIVLRANFEIQ